MCAQVAECRASIGEYEEAITGLEADLRAAEVSGGLSYRKAQET
jgi:hypothetical protein